MIPAGTAAAPAPERLTRNARLAILAGVTAAGALAMGFAGEIVRHRTSWGFPDERTLLGIPRALNVLSNLPFVIAGLLGLRLALARRDWPLISLFAGIAAVGFGSGFYHLAPSGQRLLGDRLPMAIAFVSLLIVVAADRIDARASRALVPALALGVSSLLLWYLATPRGTGDLRLYYFVQTAAVALTPLIVILFPRGRLETRGLVAASLVYGVAKLLERFDRAIYDAGHVISGHSLKHLVAGIACFFVVRACFQRVV